MFKLQDLLSNKALYEQKIKPILKNMGLESYNLSDEELSKLRKTSFLFANEKQIPVNDKAHVLAALNLLDEVDEKEAEEVKAHLESKFARLFGKDTAFEDALASVKAESAASAATDTIKTAEAVITDEVIAKIADAVVVKMKEGIKIEATTGISDQSYSTLRVDALEQEIEALETENKKLQDSLKSNVVSQILRIEDKVGDEAYTDKLNSRSLESLMDKLNDLSEIADDEDDSDDATDDNSTELSDNVSIDDAASATGTDTSGTDTTKVEDASKDDKKKMSPLEVRDAYRKTVKEKGLAAASRLIKELGEAGKLPDDFSLNFR